MQKILKRFTIKNSFRFSIEKSKIISYDNLNLSDHSDYQKPNCYSDGENIVRYLSIKDKDTNEKFINGNYINNEISDKTIIDDYFDLGFNQIYAENTNVPIINIQENLNNQSNSLQRIGLFFNNEKYFIDEYFKKQICINCLNFISSDIMQIQVPRTRPDKVYPVSRKEIINVNTMCNKCIKDYVYCTITHIWSQSEDDTHMNNWKLEQASKVAEENNIEWIWCDKYCLSNELEELNWCIPMMGDYYQNSNFSILILKGLDKLDMAPLIACAKGIINFGDNIKIRKTIFKTLLENCSILFLSNWFHRVWTAQEYWRSNYIIINHLHGNSYFDVIMEIIIKV